MQPAGVRARVPSLKQPAPSAPNIQQPTIPVQALSLPARKGSVPTVRAGLGAFAAPVGYGPGDQFGTGGQFGTYGPNGADDPNGADGQIGVVGPNGGPDVGAGENEWSDDCY